MKEDGYILITGKILSADVKNTVVTFYEDSISSVMMPGKKDFISVRDGNGVRKYVQKKLLLFDMKELHHQFQREHPEIHIGLTSFKLLRPKHCISAGSSGTHTVCVCAFHQNIKLMIKGKLHIILNIEYSFIRKKKHFLVLSVQNPNFQKFLVRVIPVKKLLRN